MIGNGFLVPFSCGERPTLRFVQFREGRIWQELPPHPASAWSTWEVRAIAFRDLNGDGIPDIVAIVSAMTGAGPTGAQPFPVAGFWLGSAEGGWKTGEKTAPVMEKVRPVNVRALIRALRRHYREQ